MYFYALYSRFDVFKSGLTGWKCNSQYFTNQFVEQKSICYTLQNVFEFLDALQMNQTMKIIGNEGKFYCQKGYFTARNLLKMKTLGTIYKKRDSYINHDSLWLH